ALAEGLGDTETQAGVVYFLGVISTLEGDFERGIDLAEKAVAVAERAGHHLTSLRLSRGLSINYAFDGRFELARRTADAVMTQIEEIAQGDRLSDLYVSALWIRDNVRYFTDDLDAALAGALESHALAVRAPNRTVTAGAASTIAQVHFLRGEYEEALRWADECLAIAEAIGNVSGF